MNRNEPHRQSLPAELTELALWAAQWAVLIALASAVARIAAAYIM